MSWRRGELWLDTELLWFRERAGVPALAGFAPPAVRLADATARARGLPPAPGGLASPPLRAAGACDGDRAVAGLCSPLAALRHGGGHGDAVVVGGSAEPDLLARHREGRDATSRLARGGATHGVPAPGARRLPATSRARASDRSRERTAAPTIEWRHATSVGLPYGGRSGRRHPAPRRRARTGSPGTRSPTASRTSRTGSTATSTRSARSSPCSRPTAPRNPGAPRVVVGDISFEGGGPMTDEHVSHQNGLDVDIYYPRLDGQLRAPVATRPDRPPARPGSPRPLRRRRSADGLRRLLDRPPRPVRRRHPVSRTTSTTCTFASAAGP